MNATAPARTEFGRQGFIGQARRLLLAGFATLGAGGAALLAVYAGSQLLVALLVAPLVGWVFQEAIAAAGVTVLSADGIAALLGTPLSLWGILATLAIAWLGIALQVIVITVAVRQVRAGSGVAPAALLTETLSTLRRLFRLSSLPLFFYFFVFAPLAGGGFLSALSQGVAIPSFITDEIVKSPAGLAGYAAFVLAMVFLATRFALTIPLFTAAEVTGAGAMRWSWRLTRGRRASVWALATLVAVSGLAILLATSAIVLAPTAIADAVWPPASPVVAGISLAIAELVGIVVVSAMGVVVIGAMCELLDSARLEAPPLRPYVERRARPRRRGAQLGVAAAAVVVVAALSAVNVPVLQAVDRAPSAFVLAHRGFTPGGVENTISSLDAAHAVGIEAIEMDVMQTKDGGFIVMHDSTLGRLADMDVAVKDLTFDEATAIEVHDIKGRTDRIPSLEEYVTRADELGQKLLVEIKLSGAETPDHVERLVAELEHLGVLGDHLYHSLDPASVETLKRLRPTLTVGLTIAFATARAPQTSADFIVVESATLSPELIADARTQGLGVFTWTVNKLDVARAQLRDGVDGIITDHPLEVMADRDRMEAETGFAGVLRDAIERFVLVF
ncbi:MULTISPECIES: glycerophosphoryl diester phosphodiesterase membrane domain-containing protein [unclassified Salinibacterium]|uniref:glycerophosphoryl diester phosphodiesterase membrane domain-containing protein n=1 Tax=unclassified Salinibacterium TaxID=2632331 RepID=UPI00143D8E92|nr:MULTISPECIES: glycerophosphoryl diester phosphodiesterase membrane domain-containing protein [unclassified Salinibacterium]